MARHHITAFLEVRAALEHALLVPPPPARSLGGGNTLRLRESMARFSSGADHVRRRSELVRLLDAIDLVKAHAVSRTFTQQVLDTGETELEGIANLVPSKVLSAVLNVGLVDAQDGECSTATVEDVALVVAAIGAGVPVDETVDAATGRLIEVCGGWTATGVAKASLLYQAYGATRSLIMAMARCPLGAQREPAVQITTRVATQPVSIGDGRFQAGDDVSLDIGAVGLEFGHGPHRCPGQDLAELIAAGVTQTVADARYGSDHD